ncbi:MAG: hypothetical protein ABIQ44_07470 [Chloroflexia bacterium]
MDERETKILQSVARGISQAAEEYEAAHPEALDKDGFLTVGLDRGEYGPLIEELDSTITNGELEWAIERLNGGCLRVSARFIDQGNFGVSYIDKECLKRFF